MVIEITSKLIVWVLSLVESFGYLGIFIGMTIESSFIPFPSEVILIPAGAIAAAGGMNIFLILLASLFGSVLGALINYSIALFLGRGLVNLMVDKYGKFVFINQKSLDKSDKYFERNGEATTFMGRLIPGIRQLISLPAGFAKMNLTKFIFFTSLGAGIWSLFLILLGYFLGANSYWIKTNLPLITIIISIVSLSFLIIYLIKKKRR